MTDTLIHSSRVNTVIGPLHQLRIGNKDIRVSATRDALGMFRNLAGGGVDANDFPAHLQYLSKQLFNDPEAISMGASLEYRRPDGELVLSAAVGSGVLRTPELALS